MSSDLKCVTCQDLDAVRKNFYDRGLNDVSIVAVSYLGQMTKEEFEGES